MRKYFTEIIGFIVGDERRHPFFGTIFFKFYNMGNLYKYSHEIKLKNKIKKIKSKQMKIQSESEKEKELDIFLDLAKQIAEGDYVIYF